MKKTRIATFLAVLAMMSLSLFSCGEKETASRYMESDLISRWQYYHVPGLEELDPENPPVPEPGIMINLMARNKATVDGEPMNWTYENNVVNAQRREGNVVYWLTFKVLEINSEEGTMFASGSYGWCESVAGTEWETDTMAGHSWPLKQPGFFARM